MIIIKIFGVILLLLWIWIIYEMWRAAVYKEDSNGKLIEIEPVKKLSNLFKRRKK